MKRVLRKLYNSSPRDLLHILSARKRPSSSRSIDPINIHSLSQRLQTRFSIYQTSNLQSVRPEEFSLYLHSNIGAVDAQSEGYSDLELDRQRDLSVKFHWGHNHDFGDFELQGRMRDRHIEVMAYFLALFPLSIDDFTGKSVFDIGCWTGGTTLLMASLGSNVLAIEEVKKYAEVASYLAKSFGIEDRVHVRSMSIYECNSKEFYDRFDMVYFPGVIYHLSDPILALRILFNSLNMGGTILVESAGVNSKEPICKFSGSLIHRSGTRERLNRSGWNWFIPSPSALNRMMREAGFDEIETLWNFETNRIYGFGRKTSQVGICKAGLSVPSIN